MPIEDYKKHIDVTQWSNVALLVLERMESYDKKFDTVIEEIKGIGDNVEILTNSISKHEVYIKVLGIPVILLCGYVLLQFLGKVF